MVRKMSSKRKEEKSTSFMFPSYHQKVVNAVSDKIPATWFNKTIATKTLMTNTQPT